jgi:carbon storage regulator
MGMLVLSFKLDEILHIGDDINVMVVKNDGHQVSLGINAPRDIPVHRDKVYKEIQQQKREKLNGNR